MSRINGKKIHTTLYLCCVIIIIWLVVPLEILIVNVTLDSDSLMNEPDPKHLNSSQT